MGRKFLQEGNLPSGRAVIALRSQVLPAALADGYQRGVPGLVQMVDEAPLVRILPDGQSRAGRVPGFDHFSIRARVRPYPFQQVQDQRFDGIEHGGLRYRVCMTV
jgi:hypothetical protein